MTVPTSLTAAYWLTAALTSAASSRFIARARPRAVEHSSVRAASTAGQSSVSSVCATSSASLTSCSTSRFTSHAAYGLSTGPGESELAPAAGAAWSRDLRARAIRPRRGASNCNDRAGVARSTRKIACQLRIALRIEAGGTTDSNQVTMLFRTSSTGSQEETTPLFFIGLYKKWRGQN